jgi:hypothetical protein
MTTVKKAIEMLSDLAPDEEIAFTGWWSKKDVERNTDVELTDEQWYDVCWKHEDNIDLDIDDVVQEVLDNG